MLHQEEAGWANAKVLAILSVVFLCGSVVGAGVMRQYMHWRLPLPAAHDFIYHGKRITFDTLRDDLNLSSDQEQTVKEALDDFAKYYQNLEEQREDVTEAGKRRISSVLNPEQKRRFETLIQLNPSK